MANLERENTLGYVDRRRSTATNRQTDQGTTSKQYVSDSTNTGSTLISVGALRTRLAAINPTYYTAARLEQMTKNDMVYAVRVADEAAGF